MNFEKLEKKIHSLYISPKIIENFPDMIIYTDSRGFIKCANKRAANFFGAMDNVTIDELVTDGLKALKRSIKQRKAVLVHSKFNENDYLELSASKIGENYCISIRDNTKIVNENIEKDGIERFTNDKNAMLVNLKSEIKSPINSITGFSQGLVDGIGGEITPKQEKYLKIILNNAKELSEFTDKFLDFSYAESLLYEEEIKKFDIVSMIKRVLKDFEPYIIMANVTTEFDYSSLKSRNITTDYKAIKLALENIIDVSLSLTKKGKIYLHLSHPNEENYITYGLNEDKEYLQLTLKDTGTNISPEDMEYICNPYAKIGKNKKIFMRSLKLGTASILVKRSEGVFSISSETGLGNLYSIIIPNRRNEDE